MQCAQIRVAVSAIDDGEDPGLDPEEVAAHLVGCEDCRAWRSAARTVGQTVGSVGSVWPHDAPDLTAEVLAAVAADKAVREARTLPVLGGFAHPGVVRWALAVSAITQLVLALPALLGDPTSGDSALHAGREMASFDVAVAIGFLFVVARPAWARALVPVAVALSGCLLLTSTIDVADGAAQFGHELNHLLAGVQAVLLVLLARSDRTPADSQSLPGSVRYPSTGATCE